MQHYEDISEYNKEGTVARKVQLRLLEMLIEFDKVCRKNNIDYMLAGGNCLGAVRHKGFIPWDDDIDIDVYYKDYPKLIQLLQKELPDWVKVQNPKTDKGYYHFYTRLVDANSIVTYADNFVRRNMKYKGLFLDIVPIGPTISYKLREKLNRRSRLSYSMYRVGAKKKTNYIKALFKLPFHLLAWHIYTFISKATKTKNLSHYFPSIYNPVFHYDNCFPAKPIFFEGYEFLGPRNPDKYLIDLYGEDYMQIPEPSKRMSHLNQVEFIEG